MLHGIALVDAWLLFVVLCFAIGFGLGRLFVELFG